MNMNTNWKNIRRIFNHAFRSSLHYSMATVTPDGLPHVTPVGSLILREPGARYLLRGIYEGHATQLSGQPAGLRAGRTKRLHFLVLVIASRWFQYTAGDSPSWQRWRRAR